MGGEPVAVFLICYGKLLDVINLIEILPKRECDC